MARATRRVAPAQTGAGGVPSDAAAQRLAEALQRRTAQYRTDASVDLTLINALLDHDGPAAARAALADHSASLDALLTDLRSAVAQAAVEREAEQVVAEAQRRIAEPAPRPLVQRIRRQLVSVAGAAALVAALLAPSTRLDGRDAVLTAQQRVAHQQLAVARQRVAELQRGTSSAAPARVREVNDRLLAVPRRALSAPAVRDEVREVMQSHRDAVTRIADDDPKALPLLDEVAAVEDEMARHGVTAVTQMEAPAVTQPGADPDPPAPSAEDVDLP